MGRVNNDDNVLHVMGMEDTKCPSAGDQHDF